MLSAAEIAAMQAIVNSSLDTPVVVKRNSSSPSNDGYGHTTETLTTVGTFNVNIIKPSATQLQAYASIIGSQQAIMIRYAMSTDIRENDIVVYNNLNWRVQTIEKAESYTFTPDALITVIT